MLHFEGFDLDLESGDLWKAGVRVKLPPQPMRILCLLVSRAGHLVSREQIQKHVWTDETFVDFEHGMNYSIRLIRSALGDDAETPRYIGTEPRRGYRFIAEVTDSAAAVSLASPPSAFISSKEEPASLGVSPFTGDSAAVQKRVGGFFAIRLWVWVLVFAVGVLCYPVYRHYRYALSIPNAASPSALASSPTTSRRSIAVLGFKNLSGRPEEVWLSTALSEMLSTELAAGRTFRIISEESISRMKIDLALGDVDSFTQETLTRIKKYSGTEEIVSGSYLLLHDKGTRHLRVDFRLQDTATGETIEANSQLGTEAGLFTLISRAGAQLRSTLGAQELSVAEATGVQSSLPNNTQATQFYSQGLDKLRAFDAVAAKDLLEKAVAVEPEFPLAHAALASAWSVLGYDVRARREAEIAFQRSQGLPREDRLSVEGQYREATHEWPRVVQVYQTLATFYPDNPDYALRLGAAQIASGDAQSALVTASGLRKLPAPIAEDPRIDYLEVRANNSLGEYLKLGANAERGVQNAKKHGAMLLVAQMLRAACWSSMEAGQPTKAIAQCEEARKIFSHAGDKGSAAAALGNQAAVLAIQGDLNAAIEKYEQSLSVFREAGDQRRVANVLINAGNLVPEGVRKQKMYGEALSIYRSIGDRRGESMALGNLGNAFVPEGDLQSAHMRYQQALALARNIGDKSLIAVWLRNDSEMLADLGDLTTAKQMATEALAMARASGDFSQVSNGLLSIGNIVRQQGDALHARQEYSEAMELRKRFGDPVRIAEVQLSLTELLLDESDWRSATSSLRDVLPRLREASLVDDELLAKAMLVEALLAQGDQTYAENEIRSGRILRQPNQKHSANFHDAAVRFSIAENRFLTSTQPAEAAAALQGLLKDANRRKYVGEQFRIRLALGEIELGSSNKASAHAHLTTLARDARAAGFILIASKAAHTEQGTQASLR